MGVHIENRNRKRKLDCMSTPGERIRALRKTRRMTQVQLAATLGIDQSTVSDIERGASFSASALQALVEVLGTTGRYIMRGGDESDLYESELVALYRAIPPEDQQSVIKMMRGLAKETSAARGGKTTA
jgi:transcriptional regulator with XRE-family HTH domain